MKKQITVIALCVMLLSLWATGEAQQPAKIRRIGYLAGASGQSLFFESLKAGLRDLGYIEGQNLVIDYRSSEDRDQLAARMTELIQLKAEVIVTQGTATRIAKSVTTTVPIVFGFSGDPIEAGLVDSLARPGRNLTGMTFLSLDLAGKRLELLKEAAPKVSRLAIVSTRTHPGEKNEFKETQTAAQVLKTKLQYLPVNTSEDLETAFKAMIKESPQAVLTFPDALTLSHRDRLADFAIKQKLPSMFGWKEYVDAGGLMSYGPSQQASFRRLAVYVDKILKGAKPADIPTEQPTKFELVINLKTAKQIGLTIPPNVLVRADKVIK
ncbi:MAG TPA: ABC transporter substrate-binding protein [Candidatus Binatia bacterium]